MAKSKTPAKRARKAEENRLRNKSRKSRLNTAFKKFELSLKSDDIDNTQETFLQLTSIIDKCVGKGILHKNNAARKKSAIAKKFNTAKLSQAAE